MDFIKIPMEDEDEGIAEALRRSHEMDRDPSVCLSHDEFLKELEDWRNHRSPRYGLR